MMRFFKFFNFRNKLFFGHVWWPKSHVNMATMFLYAVQTKSSDIINHYFFEPDHSIMESDSVHVHIETKSKNINVFDPSSWYALIQTIKIYST